MLLNVQVCYQVHGQHAMVQDSFSVQMAGVYQFLLHVLYLGVSHGTSAVTATETVLITVMRPTAPVSLQFHLECHLSIYLCRV